MVLQAPPSVSLCVHSKSVWMSEVSLFGVGKVGVSASLGEGIMNELLGTRIYAACFICLLSKLGVEWGDCLGGGGPL